MKYVNKWTVGTSLAIGIGAGIWYLYSRNALPNIRKPEEKRMPEDAEINDGTHVKKKEFGVDVATSHHIATYEKAISARTLQRDSSTMLSASRTSTGSSPVKELVKTVSSSERRVQATKETQDTGVQATATPCSTGSEAVPSVTSKGSITTPPLPNHDHMPQKNLGESFNLQYALEQQFRQQVPNDVFAIEMYAEEIDQDDDEDSYSLESGNGMEDDILSEIKNEIKNMKKERSTNNCDFTPKDVTSIEHHRETDTPAADTLSQLSYELSGGDI